MLAKNILDNIPLDCSCEVSELPNLVKGTGVKSYGLTVECDNCKSKREAQNIVNAVQRRKQEIIQELNQLDLKLIRPLSEKEDTKVQDIIKQKNILRTELQTL